jgi:site-specific recombinase XerD
LIEVLNTITHNQRNNLLILLGKATGFRTSELLSLKIGDLIALDGSVLDRVALRAANTKNGTGRVQVLHGKVKIAIKEWTDYLLSKGFGLESAIFVGRQSKGSKAISRQWVWQIIKGLFEKAAIFGQTGTHTLRKSKGNEDKAGDIQKVADASDHKPIQSTEELELAAYLHHSFFYEFF